MPLPVLQSLLLADHIYRDQATGKHVICGIFSTIFFTPNPTLANPPQPTPIPSPPSDGPRPGEGVPAGGNGPGPGIRPEQTPPPPRVQPIQNLMQAGSPFLYFSVTELKERRKFEVRYVDLFDNRVLFQTDVQIECDDPLKTIEVSLALPRLPLSALEERVYAIEVLCEGNLLGFQRVLARVTPGSVPPPSPNPPMPHPGQN